MGDAADDMYDLMWQICAMCRENFQECICDEEA
jgi:hypothetical protein